MIRPRKLLAVVLAVAGFSLGITTVWWLWETPENPRVRGRQLSMWFHQFVASGLTTATAENFHRWAGTSDAVTAILALGTNAVPFLVREALPIPRKSGLAQVFFQELRELSPPAFVGARIEPWQRTEAARRLLRELKLPGPFLLAELEPHLIGADSDVRASAIQCLGSGATEKGLIAKRLKGFLLSSNRNEVICATVALTKLGEEAADALPELLVLVQSPFTVRSHLPIALGNCGSAASNALPALEARLDQATNDDELLLTAVGLCQILPQHPAAWPLLMSVARSEPLHGSPIKRVELIRVLRFTRSNNQHLAALLLPMLEPEDGRWSGFTYEALDLMNQLDPTKADALVRQRIQRAANTHDAIAAAGRLLSLQPTNRSASDYLLGILRTNIADSSPGFLAAFTLVRAPTVPAEARELIRRVMTQPGLHSNTRKLLRNELRRLDQRDASGSSSAP